MEAETGLESGGLLTPTLGARRGVGGGGGRGRAWNAGLAVLPGTERGHRVRWTPQRPVRTDLSPKKEVPGR